MELIHINNLAKWRKLLSYLAIAFILDGFVILVAREFPEFTIWLNHNWLTRWPTGAIIFIMGFMFGILSVPNRQIEEENNKS